MLADEKEILSYVQIHSTKHDQILNEVERKTNLYSVQPRMLSGQIQGKFLEFVVDMLRPKRIAEIGTFTGYSAIAMARGLDSDAHIDTIDINDELSYIAAQSIEKAGLSSTITQHIGSALSVIPELGGVYDLVFIDGDKREYVKYFDMLMDGGYVKSGSYMLADNTLWDGKVVDRSEKNLKDNYTRGVLEFNDKVVNDPRVEVVMLPFRDGMSIIKVL